MERKNAELFFSEERKKYYLNYTIACEDCNLKQLHLIMLCTDAKKNKTIALCLNCFNKSDIHADFLSVKKVLISKDIPEDAIYIHNYGFSIANARNNEGEVSVFEAAHQSKDKEKIIDNTLQCHNPHFMIQSDAKVPLQIKADLEEIDRKLLPDQADDVLNSLIDGEPVEGRFLDWDKDENDDKKRLKL